MRRSRACLNADRIDVCNSIVTIMYIPLGLMLGIVQRFDVDANRSMKHECRCDSMTPCVHGSSRLHRF
ncbi:hypothetical protein HZ326_24501 [Fusarium oxysporum f. sp. albedinis]|nr:hypothetical protein HZ326_24501 [Fusarium oxysporum f. sp. albedinis]